MQMTEDLIRSVVEQVLSQMGTAHANGSSSRPSGTFGVYPTADAAVMAADAAFAKFRLRPLADRKAAVDRIKSHLRRERRGIRPPRAGRDQDRPPRPQDRQAPRLYPDHPGPEYLHTDIDSGDDGITLTDYSPFGVIGAITPVTHSLPTLAANAISMLSSGNTVVFNAHPSGAKVAAEGVRRFNKAIKEAIGLDDLITIIDPPTLESASALFDHRGVKLLVVTGGPAVARAALGSKRRAIVAGPGNPPVVVDTTADLENAAKSIILGAAFDNNLLCIGEKQVFAVSGIFDGLMDAVARNGGFRLSPPQIEALTKAAFSKGDDGKFHVNKDLVGMDPPVLGKFAGVSVPQGTQILFGETGEDHLFVEHEQMMPFIPFVRVPNVDRAIEMARKSEHGYGHTATLHSRDTAVMTKMGKAMDCTIFVVNGPSTAGLGGAAVPSFSIAGPTGEGVTTPLTFCRQRRSAIVGGMRFV